MFRVTTTANPKVAPSSGVATSPPAEDSSALVQSRPTLASLQHVKHGRVALLRAAIDFLAAAAALVIVMIATGAAAWPAILLAPLLPVGLSQIWVFTGPRSTRRSEPWASTASQSPVGSSLPALFAWTASLLVADQGPASE